MGFYDWLKTQDEDLVEQIDELNDYNGDLWGNFEVELGNLNVEEKAIEIYQEHPADEMSDHYEQTFHEGAVVAGDTIGEIYNKILAKFPPEEIKNRLYTYFTKKFDLGA